VRSPRLSLIVGGLLVAAVVVAALVFATTHHHKTVAAIFPQVVQLYEDDDVRVLGVPVGKVTKISQAPDGVRVDMYYDADAPVPADAKAVIVAPTLLNRRYIQLDPAKLAGPRLPDGAVLGPDRTAVPLEYDEIKKQLDQLATALGPQETQTNGALGRVLTTAADNLRGNGPNLHGSVENLAKALGTLSDGRDDLFGTVRNLQTLVTALRGADADVTGFTQELAQTSDTLAASSNDLGKALDTIDSSVHRIGEFVGQNRNELSESVKGLKNISDTLADNRQALANVLQIAPTAVSDFQNIYDPFSNAITGALAPTNFNDLNSLIGLFGQLITPVLGTFPAGTFPPNAFPERNGSRNYILETDGRCKPPKDDPDVKAPYNPALTPPQPYGGTGTQPYFTEKNKCHGGGGSGGGGMFVSSETPSLANLLLPGGGR
jgi:phospholipid/cholesterol/gamma-HCH transport system substrate-binding protein